MGTFKEHIAFFGNQKRENILFELNSGGSLTIHFREDKTDTASDKYFALGNSAKKVMITVNNVASITKINNKTLKSARTLGTDNINKFSTGIEWETIVVQADEDSTFFEVYGS